MAKENEGGGKKQSLLLSALHNIVSGFFTVRQKLGEQQKKSSAQINMLGSVVRHIFHKRRGGGVLLWSESIELS